MAEPIIFISSTCFDLDPIRDELKTFIEKLGYIPELSNKNDVYYNPTEHTHVSCIKAIENVDMVIFIIGGRFGGEAVKPAYDKIDFAKININDKDFFDYLEKTKFSITQLEVLKAIQCNIPVYTFIDKAVLSDHNTYEKTKKNNPGVDVSEIEFGAIQKKGESVHIFEFFNFLRKRDKNNAYFSWSNVKEIKKTLKYQWACMLKEKLKQDRDALNNGRKREKFIESEIVEHRSSQRIKAFDNLFTEINSGDEIKILGTGVTNFLSRKENVETYLKDDNNIFILLINDQMIKDDWACSSKQFITMLNRAFSAAGEVELVSELEAKNTCPLASQNILIDENHFNNYYSRPDYIDEVRKSYDLIDYYQKEKIKNNWPGELHVRHFYSFVPMSITAIRPDHTSNSKILVEFIIPFTENRILLKTSLNENKAIYDLFTGFFSETWERALPYITNLS